MLTSHMGWLDREHVTIFHIIAIVLYASDINLQNLECE